MVRRKMKNEEIKKNTNGREYRVVPFSPPDITSREIEEVVNALKSGWITTGPKVKELERQVAQWSGTSKAVCLNSQTACAEMTLRILGIGDGDEIVVPSYTYTATASVVDHVGAKIVMVDCEPGKFTMDYKKLENAITSKTKVIIPVEIFGIPCDYGRIMSIVEKKKDLFHPSENKIQRAFGRIIVMADGAHCFGAEYKGKSIAQYPDFINYSFHAVNVFETEVEKNDCKESTKMAARKGDMKPYFCIEVPMKSYIKVICTKHRWYGYLQAEMSNT